MINIRRTYIQTQKLTGGSKKTKPGNSPHHFLGGQVQHVI